MIYLSHKKGIIYVEKDGFFQQDNAAIPNASITKKYLLEKKFLDHPACSPDLNPIENLWGLIVANVYEEVRQYSAISEHKNVILDACENNFGSIQKLIDSMPSRICEAIKAKQQIYKILNKIYL